MVIFISFLWTHRSHLFFFLVIDGMSKERKKNQSKMNRGKSLRTKNRKTTPSINPRQACHPSDGVSRCGFYSLLGFSLTIPFFHKISITSLRPAYGSMCFSVFSFLTVRKNTSGRRGNLMGTTVEHRIPDSMLVVPVIYLSPFLSYNPPMETQFIKRPSEGRRVKE